MTTQDLQAIARLKNCPDKARILTALVRGGSGRTSSDALNAVAKKSHRDELKLFIPLFIEVLEKETDRSPNHRWAYAATALGKLGPDAQPALPVLIKRIDSCGKDWVKLQVIQAIGKIGGPEARKAVPKLKEQLKSPDPLVRKVTTEVLRRLGQ